MLMSQIAANTGRCKRDSHFCDPVDRKVDSFLRSLIPSVALLLMIAVTVPISGLYAQSTHMTSENLGLGGGGAAYVNDYHANFINPANLAIYEDRHPAVTLGIMGGGGYFGGGLANVGLYNKYLTSGKLINNVADEMYDAWFGPLMTDAKTMGADINAVPLGAVYRMKDWSISFAYRARTITDVKANRGTAEFFTFLLSPDSLSDPTPANFEANFLSASELSIGVSGKVWEGKTGFLSSDDDVPVRLYAGAAPKLLLGHNQMKFDFNSNIQASDTSLVHDFNYTIRSVGEISSQFQQFYQERHVQGMNKEISSYLKPSEEKFGAVRSVGVGLDLGLTAEFDLSDQSQFDWGSFFKGEKYLRVAVSLTDIGSINMSTDAATFKADDQLVWNGFEHVRDEEYLNANHDSSRSEYIDHVTDSITNEVYLNFDQQDQSSVTGQLPTMLHFGTQFQMGRAGLMVDVVQGLRSTGMTNEQFSAALGLEYDILDVVPVRIGLRTGGMGATSYSFGTGIELRHFEFSIAAISVNNSKSGGYYLGAAVSGLKFHF